MREIGIEQQGTGKKIVYGCCAENEKQEANVLKHKEISQNMVML